MRNKILERLVGVDVLELGGPLTLKLMLDIIMDVNKSTLRALTQSLQNPYLRNVTSENACTALS